MPRTLLANLFGALEKAYREGAADGMAHAMPQEREQSKAKKL